MGKLGDELRKKYRTPREALLALGLDEKLLDVNRLAFDGAKHMTTPTRLEYLAVTRAARAINPLLAFDAKVEYGPIFKGLNSGNLKARKMTIISDLKTALKGKTLAGDAELNVGHVAKLLDHLEHVPEPKSLDESVSGPQHRAMEAAAHGTSNLGIPKNVGSEFEHADKGKTFRDAMPAFLKEKGMSDDDIKHVMDMMPDEMPENALDEGENENVEIEVEEGEDGEIEQEEGEDKGAKDKAAKDKAAKDKAAKDKAAKDRKGAMDKGMVTKDAMNEAIKSAVMAERSNSQSTSEAREFVRPYVGELPMALDSAEKVLRTAATAMGIKNAEKINIDGLRTIIEMQPKAGAQSGNNGHDMAHDAVSAADFYDLFPDARRIGTA